MARFLYGGCDVWLNNPLSPARSLWHQRHEVRSQRRAQPVSIRDGWWDEWSDGQNGWDIASADDDPDDARRDQREAMSLFGLLEQEIVPLFYDHGGRPNREALPHGWIHRMLHNWASLGPKVTASRMVRDYVTELYEPAAIGGTAVNADGASGARALSAWKQSVHAAWPSVGDHRPRHRHVAGTRRRTPPHRCHHQPWRSERRGRDRASAARTDRPPGRTAPRARTISLEVGTDGVWSGDYVVAQSGGYGLTARVLPTHPLLANPFETTCIAWAE